MLEQFNLKLLVPTIYHAKEAGPKNHKLSHSVDDRGFDYAGEWRFDANINICEQFPARLKALTEAMSCLILSNPPSLRTIREDGLCQTNQQKRFYFPNVLDKLGRAILDGDLKLATELAEPHQEHSYFIFQKDWYLSNLYQRTIVEDFNRQKIVTELRDKSLSSSEEILAAQCNPVLLAVLSKQSSLAIELLKIYPIERNTLIEPFKLSLIQIAQKLELETLVKKLTPAPKPSLEDATQDFSSMRLSKIKF